MANAIDISRPEAELTRTALEIKILANAWKPRHRGDKFAHALLTFLGSKANAGTRRAYAFAITEFFTWYKSVRSHTPLPSEVLRADAHLFAQYLHSRALGLDEQRLEQDPERKLDLVVYRYLKSTPGAAISAIRRHLLNDGRFTEEVTFKANGYTQRARVLSIEASEPRGDDLAAFIAAHDRPPHNGLDLRLACLCQHNLLRRSPTLREIRLGLVDVGEEHPDQAQIGYRVDPELFRYYVNQHTEAQGPARSSSVANKLSGLSSFWSFLIQQSAENVPGFDRLLEHNIWIEPTAEVRKKALNRAKIHREISVPDRELFLSVLATTFRSSHGDQASAAAEAALEGVDVEASATRRNSIYEVRDQALFLFAYWTGVRAEELSSVRRSSLEARNSLITIIGKGNVTRTFVVPQPAVLAISKLQKRLDEMRRKARPDALVQLLVEPDAPLIPPLKLWGSATRDVKTAAELPGITPSAFAWTLHYRAEQAGVERDSTDWYRMHPHGIRHLAALEANRRGVDVATIQATMGHSSLSVTGIYLEVRDPLDRSLMPRSRRQEAPPPAPTKPVTIVEAPPEPAPVPTEQIELVTTKEAIALATEVESVGYLLDVYNKNWGEQKRNQRTRFATSGGGPMAHVYVGKRSALGWWAGMTGDLSDQSYSYTPNPGIPPMPIMSPAQFMGAPGSAVCSQPICKALSSLYDKWFSAPDRGPTAASALTRWLDVASRVTVDVDDALRERQGAWIGFEDPLLRGTGEAPSLMREHLDDAIVAWFEAVGWQYRPSGKSLVMPTGDIEVPDWYGQSDPIASLPMADRIELLDYLQVLVGLPPLDQTPRYQGKSRAELGKVLSAVCTYEKLAADKSLRTESKRDYGTYLKAAEEDIRRQVDRLTLGRVTNFFYSDTKEARHAAKIRAELEASVAARTGESAKAQQDKRLASHFMDVLASIVGPEVREDPILNMQAMCTAGVPLERAERGQLDRFKSLFRVVGTQIVHTPAFSREFAAETGQHSECVARRLARHIWEKGKLKEWYERKNWSDPYLDALVAYRVPCPAEQEDELRKLLGDTKRQSVYEEWQKAQRGVLAAVAAEELSEIEDVRREEEGRRIEGRITRPPMTPNPAGEHRAMRQARKFLLNPVEAMPIVFAMRSA